MYIRPKIRAQINLILAITLFWMLCGAFLAVYKCVTYDVLSEKFIFIVPQSLSLGAFVLINMIGPTIGGLIGGGMAVMVLNEKLGHRSYRFYLFVNLLYFFVFILFLNIGVSYFYYFKDDIQSADAPFLAAIELLIFNPYAIRNVVTWMIVAWFTIQGIKIHEKYGAGTILSMLLGRYHRPREVQRAFMFLDLSNSTSVAERLGHVKFFSLLSDFFFDITDPILNSKGEIYQYVGDEIIVSWPLVKSVMDNCHPIACSFKIGDTLKRREPYYLQKYGLLPDFKTAVHLGKVVVGEIGVIKKEIVYSGDILNTTARMLEQCKVHKQKLIISGDVVSMLSKNCLNDYNPIFLGDMVLRGKKQTVALYGVSSI